MIFSSSVESTSVKQIFKIRGPYKNKSNGVTSGERGGQETSSPLLIQLFERLVLK